MAYLLVIRFEDKEQAKAKETADDLEDEGRLVGAYYVPDENTPYCRCFDGKARPLHEQTARGAKFNWWVCQICGKPRYKSGHSPKNLRPQCDPKGLLFVTWLTRNYKD